MLPFMLKNRCCNLSAFRIFSSTSGLHSEHVDDPQTRQRPELTFYVDLLVSRVCVSFARLCSKRSVPMLLSKKCFFSYYSLFSSWVCFLSLLLTSGLCSSSLTSSTWNIFWNSNPTSW